MTSSLPSTIEQMFASTPSTVFFDGDALADCLDACAACEVVCRACADACLGEREVDLLRRCIRTNLDCAALCHAAVDVGARPFAADASFVHALFELCARICATCAAECHKHVHHDHCRVCADACRACEAACRTVLGT